MPRYPVKVTPPAASLLVLPRLQVRQLVDKYMYQFRKDICGIQDLTGREVESIRKHALVRDRLHFTKGNGAVVFHSQIINGRPILDKADRIVFYLVGTPLEVSACLNVDLVVPEILKEENVAFIFHMQYALGL